MYSEDRFPKLFCYEKLFVRFAKYLNAKRAYCTKSKSTKVPKFRTDIRLLSVTVWAKEILKILFWSKVTCMILVTKSEKVCLGLIAPKFEVPQGWPSTGLWWFYIIKCTVKIVFQNFFPGKVIRPFRKILKCETGSLHEKWKYLGAQILHWF